MSFVHCEKSILVVPRTSPGGGLPVGCFYSEQGFGEEAEILPDFELHSGTVRSLLSEQLWRRPYLPCSHYYHNLHEYRWSKLSVLSWSEPALSGSTLGQFYFCWQPTLSSWSPSSMLWSLSSGPVDRESQQIIRTGKLLKLFLSSSLSLVLPISSLFWVSKVFPSTTSQSCCCFRSDRLFNSAVHHVWAYPGSSLVHPGLHCDPPVLLPQHRGEDHPAAQLQEVAECSVVAMMTIVARTDDLIIGMWSTPTPGDNQLVTQYPWQGIMAATLTLHSCQQAGGTLSSGNTSWPGIHL